MLEDLTNKWVGSQPQRNHFQHDLMDFVKKYHTAQLRLSRSGTMVPVDKCTRVEVIDENGRSYVNKHPANQVEISIQDNDM